VRAGIKFPPSLQNIFKELQEEYGYAPPRSGELTEWAKRGVLLLNTTLTVRQGMPQSHKGHGWEILTDRIISLLNQKDGGEWQPEDLVRVRILMTDLGEYENVAIAHMKDDGSMNLIRAYISGDYLEFDTDEFSKFGIVGFHGTMEELMIEQEDHDIWLYFIPGIGAAVLLLILVVVRLSGSKRKKVIKDE
jgi:hypothetical protein